MTSLFSCVHCKQKYRRRKGQPFGRLFCSKRCFFSGQKISVDEIYKRDNGICHLCDRWVPRSEASRDHVRPRHHGGKTTWENIRLAHRDCNSRRGHKDVKDYVEWWETQLAARDPVLPHSDDRKRPRPSQ
jgi:hypothetical protein